MADTPAPDAAEDALFAAVSYTIITLGLVALLSVERSVGSLILSE